jgi:hypothetical protein
MKLYEVFKPMAAAIAEALQPSEYRQVVKGWNKERWAELFKGKYRLYIPLETSSTDKVIPNKQVVDFLKLNGFTVKDYAKNLAIDANGREKRIGSIIAKNPTIKKLYDNDPARQGSNVQGHQIVVISRHPYDIAAMSTDRGWTSCMNIRDGGNRHFIPIEIKAGTIIAYLIDKNDKNINDASARVLIKPFISNEIPYYTEDIEDDYIVLGIQDKVYGTANDSFIDTVKKWVDEVNQSRYMDGVFTLHSGVYDDSGFGKTRVLTRGKKAEGSEFFQKAFKHVISAIDENDIGQVLEYTMSLEDELGNIPDYIINKYLPKLWQMSFYLDELSEHSYAPYFLKAWNTSIDKFREFNLSAEGGSYDEIVPFYMYDMVEVNAKNAQKLSMAMHLARISYGKRHEITNQIINHNSDWKYYL